MATNPKLPSDEQNLDGQNLNDTHSHVVLTSKRSNPWPLILVIIAAAILIALIAWVVLSRPQRTSAPPSTPAPTSELSNTPKALACFSEHL